MIKKTLFLHFIALAISWKDQIFSNENKHVLRHVEGQINHDASSNIEEADHYFEAALYTKAIPIYQKILLSYQSAKSEKIAHARSQLAKSLFLIDDFKNVIALFKENKLPLSEKEKFLRASANGKIGNYDLAIQELQTMLKPHDPSTFSEEVSLELGIVQYLSKNYSASEQQLRQLFNQAKSNKIRYTAGLYLTKGYLDTEDPAEAEKVIQALGTIPNEGLFHYECSFLLGETYFQKENFEQACKHFEKALPSQNPQNIPWYSETRYRLGISHLKMGSDADKEKEYQKNHLDQAEQILKTIYQDAPEERILLSLGQCYLTMGRCLDKETAYQEAEKILSSQEIPLSLEAQALALLLRAEAAPSYEKRDTLYRHLTQDAHCNTQHYIKGWYLRGLNEFQEAQRLSSNNQKGEADQAYERAISSLTRAFELLKNSDPSRAGLAIKYQAQAAFFQQSLEKSQKALSTLYTFMNDHSNILKAMDDPDEIYFLYAQIAAHMEQNLEAENAIQESLQKYPNGKFADSVILLQGILYSNKKEYELAETTFLNLVTKFPESFQAGEALFWAAQSAKMQQKSDKYKEYLKQIYTQYPASPLAPEAYFSLYTYADYLQGEREAIKHLQLFPEKFSDTPFLMHAWYLIGLDYKRDRKTPEGKWIRKKNFNESIDAFHHVETTFDSLYKKRKIPQQDLAFLTTIRYRSMLERGLANLAIADESQGTKRHIYLDYARELLKLIANDFTDQTHPLYMPLTQTETCGHIQEESTYWLAVAYSKSENDEDAEKILTQMCDKYQSAKITRGYFLSRCWNEKGLIRLRKKDYSEALKNFSKAEDASKGKILTTDQKLELWIQQSLCYCAMHDYDNAILILSKVVNDDSISGLRIKAMYLRAELYELQGRHEVARRQLEATSKKGGEWALKAKEKLEKEYGYK